ncbi:unnamed protein product, partial [Vitis vinifera]|uniref:Uncharacterized protein n=1 Tax=Vitis vinifera TaxID=29760 RepID=D7TA44_VITVI
MVFKLQRKLEKVDAKTYP